MSTVKSLAETGLDFIGVDGFTKANPAQTRTLARMITAALQEISTDRPDLFTLPIGANLASTRSISATVTAGSTSIVFHETLGPYTGRTMRIPGDGADNQVSTGSSEIVEGGNTTCQLRRAFAGATGTLAATIFGDAVCLPAGYTKVLGNVDLVGYGLLQPVADRAEFLSFRDSVPFADYGMGRGRRVSTNLPDQPAVWWADTAYRPSGAAAPASTAVVLRVAPLPDRAYTLEFDVCALPTSITADAFADGAADVIIPMPGGLSELILEPYFLQRWTGTPWFKNEKARREISRQYEVAKSALIDYSAQSQAGGRFFIGCQ